MMLAFIVLSALCPLIYSRQIASGRGDRNILFTNYKLFITADRWKDMTVVSNYRYPYAVLTASSKDGKHLFASQGNLLKVSHNYGTSWHGISLHLGGGCSGVASDASGDFLVVTTERPCAVITFSGVEWSVVNSGNCFAAVESSDNGKLLVATSAVSGIVKSTDFGRTWQSVYKFDTLPPPHASVDAYRYSGIAVNSNGQYVLFCSSNGMVHVSIDYGSTWNTMQMSITFNYCDVTIDDSGRHMVVTGNKHVARSSVHDGHTYVSAEFGALGSWIKVADYGSFVVSDHSGRYLSMVGGETAFTSANYGYSWDLNCGCEYPLVNIVNDKWKCDCRWYNLQNVWIYVLLGILLPVALMTVLVRALYWIAEEQMLLLLAPPLLISSCELVCTVWWIFNSNFMMRWIVIFVCVVAFGLPLVSLIWTLIKSDICPRYFIRRPPELVLHLFNGLSISHFHTANVIVLISRILWWTMCIVAISPWAFLQTLALVPILCIGSLLVSANLLSIQVVHNHCFRFFTGSDTDPDCFGAVVNAQQFNYDQLSKVGLVTLPLVCVLLVNAFMKAHAVGRFDLNQSETAFLCVAGLSAGFVIHKFVFYWRENIPFVNVPVSFPCFDGSDYSALQRNEDSVSEPSVYSYMWSVGEGGGSEANKVATLELKTLQQELRIQQLETLIRHQEVSAPIDEQSVIEPEGEPERLLYSESIDL